MGRRSWLFLNGAFVTCGAQASDLVHQDDTIRRVLSSVTASASSNTNRQLGLHDDDKEDPNMNCDGAFLGCLGNDKCSACFTQLDTYQIDWASVAGNIPCAEVAAFLRDEKLCASLNGDHVATTAFCQTFHSCAFWSKKDYNPAEHGKGGGGDDDKSDGMFVDCEGLTACHWEGMRDNFLGDGICHEDFPGCYNTAICGYDGGDCCKDTCKTNKDSYVECGHEGWACRNPDSQFCDVTYASYCKKKEGSNSTSGKVPECPEGTTVYRLLMYDSFGDGWDTTTINITDDQKKVLFQGALTDGGVGTEFVCLSKDSTKGCYHVEVGGGVWGKEVSWEVRPFSEGSVAIAGGGSPTSCDFSTGSGCASTCYGRPTEDPTKDPAYKEFKDLYTCIEKRCVIQVGACRTDKDCTDCLKEQVADSCHSVATFNAVIDCTLCQCTDKQGSDYCMNKANPGMIIPGQNTNNNNQPSQCTPGEVMKGGKAVMSFSKCTNFDSTAMLVTNFDQNNFGDLDLFESCAHDFAAKGVDKTALGCLQILVDAKDGKMQDETSGTVDKETVSALAKAIYENGESLCDCAKRASEECPLCPSFLHFKTLLYETLDACMALDEIDCAAWQEFFPGCKANLESTYNNNIDFSDKAQCDFVKKGCGGAGAYPVFRRLDCYKEIPSNSWDFHNEFAKACLSGDSPSPPAPTAPVPTPSTPNPVPGPTPTPPVPTPVAPPVKPTNKPTDDVPKPYVPPEERNKKEKTDYSSDDDETKESHWFRNFVLFPALCYGIYWAYRRRRDAFTFNSYRALHRNFGDDDMYSGLAMESSTSFEPPSLPPPPSAMGGSSYSMGGSGHYGQF